MPDYTSAYRTSAERVAELIEQVPDEKLTIMVPACPEWSVKDLIAHFAGVAGDVATGNLTAVGSEEWTSAQIATRKETPVGEILEEFRTQAAQLAGAIEHLHPAIAGMMLGDLVTHEHDLRGAIGKHGERNSEGVAAATYTYVRRLGRKLRDAELPTVLVVGSSGRWPAGKGEPQATVTAADVELLRALTGRRTEDEIRALEWDGDPETFLPYFSAYGHPPRSLGEQGQS
ncbi:MAG: maleylpyruvate isomerase family mycothiol-dependent enzyme [Actinomycetota bacterium]